MCDIQQTKQNHKTKNYNRYGSIKPLILIENNKEVLIVSAPWVDSLYNIM